MINGSITQRGGVSGSVSGGVGGTSDYNDLANRPSINNIILEGNKTGHDLGLSNYNELENRPSINNIMLEGNKSGHDLGLANYDDIIHYHLIKIKLFENNTGTPITNITLNDSINDYDLILISGICNTDNRSYRMTACYTPNELSAGLSGTLLRWSPNDEFLNFDVIDDKHLNVFQYNKIYVNAIYGYRLGAVV